MKKKETTAATAAPVETSILPTFQNHFGFPYDTMLSFESLIKKLETNASDPENVEAPFLREILKNFKAIPELMEPIRELSIIEKYRKEVDLLMSTILPSSIINELISGVIIPFQPVTIYSSPKFKKLLPHGENGIWDLSKINVQKGRNQIIAFAGLAILEKYYGFKMDHREMMKNKQLDNDTGVTSYFQTEINPAYVEVIALKEPKPLSEIDLTPLNDDFFNPEFWLKNFPPDTFAFRGFAIYRLIDITDRELVSQLEYTLLQTTSIISRETILDIEKKFRSYFKAPGLRVGLAPMLSYQGQMASCGAQNWYCFIPVEKMQMLFENFGSSIYQDAILKGKPTLVEDITLVPHPTAIEEELLRQGIRTIILVPILRDSELIGAIEIGSATPGELNFMTLLKLKEIMPVLSVSFQRAAKDFETRVQTAIKEQFTSIHPAVEWKFAQVTLDAIGNGEDEGQTRMPLIEFKDVTPVYGQVDIRGSSDKRNEAIRQDLIEYLSAAKQILKDAFAHYPLAILDELSFRIDKYLSKLLGGMDSGDETGILEFMKMEVEPSFKVLSEKDNSLKQAVEKYFALLDPEHEVYHVRRKEFENSLTKINDLVAEVLDEEEHRTQALLPHYFEKYKTDGVEYNIYLGQSILQKGNFDPLYVKSFRLWQLITMIDIARKTHQLVPELPMALETTQLILCYSNPFAIMFRMDEKRFDVAGAYNIRYEIVKKRIDKAHVKDTRERITQPHKIAIIYTQEKEEKEYQRYFDYLRSKGMIKDEVEHLEVEPLQGMQGLKALRITVDYETEVPRLEYDEEELMRQVRDVMV